MLNAKTVHFFGKVLKNRPREFPDMVRRRLYEMTHTPPEGIAQTRFGSVRYPVDMSQHAITRKYYFQTHEMFLERIFRDHLRPGQTFIDIGANMGYWSAFAAMRVGKSGTVHAFEPVPHFYQSVARLRDENPDYRITAINAAVGARAGQTVMQVVTPTAANYNNFDTNIGSSSALPGFLDHAAALTHQVTVDVIAMDDYCTAAAVDLDQIGLIKIDVEGFESYVLDGMAKLIAKNGRKVPILCEILTDPARHEKLNGRMIIERLQDNGYKVLDATTLKPINKSALQFEENILCV